MGDTFEDIVTETEQKESKIDFLENKIRFPNSKVLQKMKKLGLIKYSSKREGDRSLDRINISPNIRKYI